jgi:hypothetical protein
MPSLKDLQCFIELPGTDKRLQEFGTTYNDGCVETFVAVPSGLQPFAIRLFSSGFIAPGLAMYVFIDGVYQCNRNRQNLKFRKSSDRKALIDFRVRQKEEKQKDGTTIAHEWSFGKPNIGKVHIPSRKHMYLSFAEKANGAIRSCSSNILENAGCIEVLVLRCAGQRNAKSASKASRKAKAHAVDMDGVADKSEHSFDMEGHRDNFGGPQFDDRVWHQMHGRPIAGQCSPVLPSTSFHGLPPPLSPQSRLTNALHSLGETRQLHRQVTPVPPTLQRSGENAGTGHPPRTFQYGSGPIPHRTRGGGAAAPAPTIVGGNVQGFDPNALEQLLAKAVKHGFVEVQRQGSSQLGQCVAPTYAAQDLPGAWPSSPFGTTTQPDPFVADTRIPAVQSSVARGLQDTSWRTQSAPGSFGDYAGWGQPKKSAVTAAVSNNNTKGPGQDNQVSWDSDEIWESKKQGRDWGGSARSRRWQRSKSRHTSKSRPWESVWESGIDKDGWTYVEAQSDTDSSWSATATVQPSNISAASHNVAALPTSTAFCRTLPQNTSTWVEMPAMIIPPPPGFDCEGAPGPFADHTAIFSEWKTEADEIVDWRGRNKSKRASSACIYQNSWGGNDEDQRPKNAKTIVTVNGEWRDPKAYYRGTSRKNNGTRFSLPKDVYDWNTLGNDLLATANGWTDELNKPNQDTHQQGIGGMTSNLKPRIRRSRLSHYHKNRSSLTTTDAKPTAHWQFPPPPPLGKQIGRSSTHADMFPAEQAYILSKEKAEGKGVEHQIRTGKGVKYDHYIGRPEYVDPLDKPVGNDSLLSLFLN